MRTPGVYTYDELRAIADAEDAKKRRDVNESIEILELAGQLVVMGAVDFSTPTPDPTPDFGGFDGGASGGAGATGDF